MGSNRLTSELSTARMVYKQVEILNIDNQSELLYNYIQIGEIYTNKKITSAQLYKNKCDNYKASNYRRISATICFRQKWGIDIEKCI